MISYEPEGYICPFCDWLAGNETEYKQNGDIVYQTKDVTAFIAPKWWVNNPGHVIVIPNTHHENIYSIDDEPLSAVYGAVKKVATAIRETYACTGTSTRQHNEPTEIRMSGIFMCMSFRDIKMMTYIKITITKSSSALKSASLMLIN